MTIIIFCSFGLDSVHTVEGFIDYCKSLNLHNSYRFPSEFTTVNITFAVVRLILTSLPNS